MHQEIKKGVLGKSIASRHLWARASQTALLAVALGIVFPTFLDTSADAALAQGHSGGKQGGKSGGGHSGGSGHDDGGHDDGGHDDGGHDDGGHDDGHDDGDHDDEHGGKGKGPRAGHTAADTGGSVTSRGQGGPDTDSEGRGPRYGKTDDPKGGKPVWAQEGIPEVELGRLNVARSPDHVLQRAYDEALSNFTAEMAAFYNLSLSEAVAELSLNFDSLTYVDSPLQNLALLKDALDGSSILNAHPGVSNSVNTLEAMFLGTASDKTVPITPDTVVAVTTILGFSLSQAEAATLATDAEAIRIAVLAGHG
jgi:hypothetical protein